MLKEFKDKLINNDVYRVAEKYYIVSNYYSKNGDILNDANGAYTQTIKVIYDIVTIYNKDNSENSMLLEHKPESNEIIETQRVNDISSIVEQAIHTKLTALELLIVGPADSIELTDILLLKIFNFFNNVTIKLNEGV